MPPVPTSVFLYAAFVALVGVQRLWEVAVGTRHARALLAKGGVERGRAHLGVMVCVHTAFLAACPLEAWLLRRPFVPALAALGGVLFLFAQGIRYWAIGTLGERWTIRVIALEGAPVVTGGPYRFMRHPNYVAIVVEFVAIPLIHAAWLSLAVFSIANALVLARRIRVEEALLRETSRYAAVMDAKPRLVPGRVRGPRG